MDISTKGLLYIPGSFNIRNFSMLEIYELSRVDNQDITKYLIRLFSSLTSPQINFNLATVEELVELLTKFYILYYSNTIEIPYTPTEKDLEFLKDKNPELYTDLLGKKWNPKTVINLTKLKTYNPVNLKKNYNYKNSTSGLTFKCRFPLIKDYLEFKDINDNEDLSTVGTNANKGPNEDLFLYCIINNDEEDININLMNKIEKYKNSISVFDLMNAYNKLSKIKLGIKPEYTYFNPITQKEESGNLPSFQFKPIIILEAVFKRYISGFNDFTFE